jgi:hypothetical protein
MEQAIRSVESYAHTYGYSLPNCRSSAVFCSPSEFEIILMKEDARVGGVIGFQSLHSVPAHAYASSVTRITRLVKTSLNYVHHWKDISPI